MNWIEDKNWSDQFISQIKQIVGPRLLKPAKLSVDQSEATDLVVLTARDMAIACRIRRPGFLPKYADEFTIRCHRDSGSMTEFEKITNGWGDWMFYAHSNNSEDGFALWWLLDLRAFRAHLIRNFNEIESGTKSNGDGTGFKWFAISSFPDNPRLVIARNQPRRISNGNW